GGGWVPKALGGSQFSSSFGQGVSDGSPCANPTPCRPCSNTCSSYGTFFLRSARTNIRLFSTGTAVSSPVWNKKVGGVSSMTCFSFDIRSINCCGGFSPSRFCREPLLANGSVIVITG